MSMGKYFTVVLAGLGGQSPHMLSGTVLALSRLLFQVDQASWRRRVETKGRKEKKGRKRRGNQEGIIFL